MLHANDMRQFLEGIAMKVANRMLQRDQCPATRALLPHLMIANTYERNVNHFSGIDWKYLALILPVAAATLCSTTPSNGMPDFVHVVRHFSGLGGTESSSKTPLIDTALALWQQEVPQ